MKIDYPKIQISFALEKTEGNQAELARLLGYKRAYINELVRSDTEFLPEVAAWRFKELFSEQPKTESSVAA